jgi:hypothetical protein
MARFLHHYSQEGKRAMVSDQNKLGFYYRPDDQHYSQADLHNWLSVLKNLQIGWLVLRGRQDQLLPQPFIQGLQLAGIEPIIHVPVSLQDLNHAEIDDLLPSYADWGIRHMVIGDRPNLRSMWKPSDWARGGLVEQFLDKFLPIWNSQMKYGFQPVFPALEPGGDYWDTAFLTSCLKSLQRRSKDELANELILAMYAWSYGRPLDWGTGGPSAWPESKPYQTPDGSQDQCGLRIVDWYSSISREAIGSELKMLVLAGGVHPEDRNTSSQDVQADIHASLARDLLMSRYSDNLVSFSFYTLSADPDQALIGWYDKNLAGSKSAEALERLMLAVPEPKPVSSPIKPIANYILLPSHAERDLSSDWKGIEPLVMALKPVIGFSLDEARLARQVILIGEQELFPADSEQLLREQGCKVRRFSNPNSEEVLLAVSDLAAKQPSTTGADHV